MRTLHRLSCILVLLTFFAAACGGDDGEDSSPTTQFSPTATTAVSASPTTGVDTSAPAGAVVQGVTDGANCSPQGARGVTRDGLAVICAIVGGEPRWRPA